MAEPGATVEANEASEVSDPDMARVVEQRWRRAGAYPVFRGHQSQPLQSGRDRPTATKCRPTVTYAV